MPKRRTIALLVAAALLTGSLTACGKPVADAKTLTYWASNQGSSLDFDKQTLQPELAKFDEQTFFGPLKFSPSGQNIVKFMSVVQIQNGQVFSDGSGAQVAGRVTPRGVVSVRVRKGTQEAVGSGRLTQVSGSGRWSGASPQQQCAGHWIAERRAAQ